MDRFDELLAVSLLLPCGESELAGLKAVLVVREEKTGRGGDYLMDLASCTFPHYWRFPVFPLYMSCMA
jgi:hypothetical protein